MKAKYQIPMIEWLDAESESAFAASLPNDLVGEGQNLNEAPTTEATSGNLSRTNIWDDED